jgi:hypothetical protein
MKCICPSGLTAESMLTPNRCPVVDTVGVRKRPAKYIYR